MNSFKEHHALVVVGLVLTALAPVTIAGLHLAGGSLIISGIIRWIFTGSGSTETYRVP